MKNLFIIFVFMLFNSSLIAKDTFGTDFSIGLKGGLNFNKLNGQGWEQTFATNLQGGFFAHINKKHIGIQLEALYVQNAITTDSNFYGLYHQYTNNIFDSLTKGSFQFNSISVPILLNIKLAQWFWVQLGPQFDATLDVIDKKEILKSGSQILQQQNYSGVAGIWIQMGGKAPLIRVNFGARYITSLNNLSSFQTNDVWRNQRIQLHLGLSY
ncbi:MAG TPA: hypothetical protein PKA54_02330 [Chitinophagaceae bacterium]|nr:MAG: membrane protein [Bacteroidetes bacterium OLB11]HMN32190.1 hypothetical protein [Chitinophagaceae bacterium]